MAVRTTQTPVEVLGSGNVEAQVTQIPVEVLGQNTADVRITQVPVEVLGEEDNPDVRLTQLPVEVLGVPNPNCRITQYYVEVLGSNVGASIETISIPPTNPTQIVVTTTWTNPVFVSGTPCITVQLDSGPVQACFTGGSGTNTLTFTYNLQPGEFDSDGTVPFASPITGGFL